MDFKRIEQIEKRAEDRFYICKLLLEKLEQRIDDGKIFHAYMERRKIDETASMSEEGEVKLREYDWRMIGKLIWGSLRIDASYNYDRAMLLHLSRIIAQIACMYYRYGIFKNARAVIAGRSGIGKTTYALLSMYGCFRLCGLGQDDSWRLATALWFMDAVEFAIFMKYVVDSGLYLPALLIDEAGLAISKYWIFGDRNLRRAFSGLLEIFDLIKDWIGVLLLTSTSQENVAKRLRDIYDYVIIGDEYSLPDDKAWFTVWVLKRKKLRFYEAMSYVDRSVIRRAKLEEMPIYIDVIPSTIKIPEECWMEHKRDRRERVRERLDTFLTLMLNLAMRESEVEEEE